jgi:hypothetical protein
MYSLSHLYPLESISTIAVLSTHGTKSDIYSNLLQKIMTFKFCPLSAAIGYATCYFENFEDVALDEALAIGIDEFVPDPEIDIDSETMAALIANLDITTQEYQSRWHTSTSDQDKAEDADD